MNHPPRASVCLCVGFAPKERRAPPHTPDDTMRKRILALTLTLSMFSFAGCSQLSTILPDLVDGGGLSEETVIAGLKEAMQVGTNRTVNDVSSLNGFLGNALIMIVMPEELEDVMGTISQIGFSRQVEELEVQMNRAAEAAAGEAVDVFVDAIRGITIQDAWSILRGDSTAMTTYFRDRTTQELTSRFRPIVETKIREVGLYQGYTAVTQIVRNIPLLNMPEFDLETYVVDKSLSGLFTILGREETRIREDISSRSTDLLRRVFAAQDDA